MIALSPSSHYLSLHYVEKRKSPRLPCHLPLAPESRKKYGFHHIADLSLNGVGVVCERPVAVTSDVKLVKIQFYLPGYPKPVEAAAKMTYADGKMAGLHLMSLDKEAREKFREYYLSVNHDTALEEVGWGLPPSTAANGSAEPAQVETPHDIRLPSDKRTSARRPLSQEFRIELTTKGLPRPIVGKVTDESRHGVSFEMEHKPGVPLAFRIGHLFSDGLIVGKNKTVRTGPARVCHITPLKHRPGAIKVGLSIVPQKQTPVCSVEKTELDKIKPEPTNGAALNAPPAATFPIPVHFKNAQHEPIAGLLNTTFGNKSDAAVPAVVIVPGYGQRKESGALLAQVLIQTFLHHKKDVAVLRFDLTRSVGESFTDLEGEIEEAEYLTFTFSQALEDVKAALRYAAKNGHFTASKLIVISSDFATPLARRAILDEEKIKTALWINFFGSTDPQSWIKHEAGGVDYVGRYARGVRSGIVKFRDSLINTDRVCSDLLKSRMGTLEDARREMAQLASPVVWICGGKETSPAHKKAAELMAVPSPAPRKLVETDGPSLNLSHVKAASSFYLVAEEIHSALFGKRVKACAPDVELFKKITEKEWSRLK